MTGRKTYALSWVRDAYWATLLGKWEGRAVSDYPNPKRADVEATAAHINSINPDMDCQVETFIQ